MFGFYAAVYGHVFVGYRAVPYFMITVALPDKIASALL
jgi:hypothetical protein